MRTGNPSTLGATIAEGGVNFSLYSSVAERVELCLFDHRGCLQQQLDLPTNDNNVWHGFVPGLIEGQRYGYRVHGSNTADNRSSCAPSKLLIDPYARQLDSELKWHASLFATNKWDSAPHVPKGVVRRKLAAGSERPLVPWAETIFYELNVRGYTMQHPAVDEGVRGRFSGLRNKDVIDYLKALGMTSVELMPVHAFADEHHLFKLGLRNFWGYNTLNFFAPAMRYANSDPIVEFQDMVNTIHDAGLEVILDVVYNHTAESGRAGPTLSFRGIDERAYYRIAENNEYINDTGCGNTIDADSPVAQKIVLDSLRYWASDMGVDGFRFDLASILGRHAHGYNREHPLLTAISADPHLSRCKLIAEPWDPGPGGYQLGNFAHPWAEWNDKFRDATRAFWRGDIDVSGEFAKRLRASADIFEASGRKPHTSVNKVCSHDGYTLSDLVSYECRHNEANGENNRDGHNNNFSCNYGVEGPTTDIGIGDLRRRHRLNLLASLFLAQGTPLLLAGDEFGNSQGGNNNAYAQDNETGWLDWQSLESDPEFAFAVRMLISMRKQMKLLQIDRYLHGEANTDTQQLSIRWLNPNGTDRDSGDWGFGHAFCMLLQGESAKHKYRSIAVLFNAWNDAVDFLLPTAAETEHWELVFSSDATPGPNNTDAQRLPGHSVAIFATRR